MEFLPLHVFRQCVDSYNGNYKVKEFTCLDQYYSMAFAQITYWESLRDIEACLRAQHGKLYHMGVRGPVSRNTLANANKVRDWRIYADLALSLIATARRLYIKEAFLDDLNETVYALDATTIDLCCPCSLGRISGGRKELSSSIPCWICATISRPSSTSQMENSTRSTLWISFPSRQALSISWTGATWTMPVSIVFHNLRPSL